MAAIAGTVAARALISQAMNTAATSSARRKERGNLDARICAASLRSFARPKQAKAPIRRISVAAAYALEHLGGQGHAYRWDEFQRRYEEHFGPIPAFARSGAPRDE